MAITVTIDGRTTSVDEGTTILKAAREMGIQIPTLCHNDAVESYASCRVCIVVVSDGKGWSKIVTSCNYEVSDGLQVNTKSEEIMEARREILDLMLSSHPEAAPVRELAAQYGITSPSYPGQPGDDCILCGLCVRVCEQVVGVAALGFSHRGPARKMVSPFSEPSPACIGCGSCVYICPTQCLHIVDQDNKRILYKQNPENIFKEFELLPCKSCKKPFLPKEQSAYVQKKLGLPRKVVQTCSSCGGPKT